MNDDIKEKHKSSKDDKVYITKMSPQKLDKIGSSSLLDKQWSDKPMNLIKNPHKLSEIELYRTLEKIVELPEKRLRSMIKQGNAIDEVFMVNIMQRIPLFLTTTLVNLCKTLILNKDYFKDHMIWKPLEQELFRRRNNLNNEQLAAVIHSFGITGNGSKQFFNDMEEVVIDSPIKIETEFLEKILLGYTQIDQGTPVFYADIVEKLIDRGLENLEVIKIAEIARNLSRASNVHKAGYGFYNHMEKLIHQQLHEGKITFQQLTQIVENILPFNIGSNEFHLELEDFLLKKYTNDNLQDIVNLIKGLQSYSFKNKTLELVLFKTIEKYVDEFTIKQLETLIWAVSKQLQSQENKVNNFEELPELKKIAVQVLIEKVKTKSPSMKPRGVAFAVESIANLNYKNEETFKRLEKVVLSKLDEFIPHYIVKVLSSYYNIGFGSGDLYDKLISQIVNSITAKTINYSDMLRFYEIFPEVSYIYENTMTEELYTHFIEKIQSVIKDKKFPTEDVCRVFNIMVRISPYQSKQSMENKENQKFVAELVGRLRHSVYDIPKEYFCETLSNLIEFQQPDLASKFIFIVQEVAKKKTLDQEFNEKERILLFWSLMQIEKACKDKSLINPENLRFLNDCDISKLSPKYFQLYKQLACLVQMWQLSQQEEADNAYINFESIYEKIQNLSLEKREEFINEDSSTKTQQQSIHEIVKVLKKKNQFSEICQNLSDDIMNLIEIALVGKDQKSSTKISSSPSIEQQAQLNGILLMNKHCYIQGIQDDEPIVKRSVELKQDILEQLFAWNLYVIDESDFLKATNKEQYLLQRMKLEHVELLDSKDSKMDQSIQLNVKENENDNNQRRGGRKVKRCRTSEECSTK